MKRNRPENNRGTYATEKFPLHTRADTIDPNDVCLVGTPAAAYPTVRTTRSVQMTVSGAKLNLIVFIYDCASASVRPMIAVMGAFNQTDLIGDPTDYLWPHWPIIGFWGVSSDIPIAPLYLQTLRLLTQGETSGTSSGPPMISCGSLSLLAQAPPNTGLSFASIERAGEILKALSSGIGMVSMSYRQPMCTPEQLTKEVIWAQNFPTNESWAALVLFNPQDKENYRPAIGSTLAPNPVTNTYMVESNYNAYPIGGTLDILPDGVLVNQQLQVVIYFASIYVDGSGVNSSTAGSVRVFADQIDLPPGAPVTAYPLAGLALSQKSKLAFTSPYTVILGIYVTVIPPGVAPPIAIYPTVRMQIRALYPQMTLTASSALSAYTGGAFATAELTLTGRSSATPTNGGVFSYPVRLDPSDERNRTSFTAATI